MNRTLGFFLGSAAVFAMLVYILGQPVPLAPPENRNIVAADGYARTEAVRITAPESRQAGVESLSSAPDTRQTVVEPQPPAAVPQGPAATAPAPVAPEPVVETMPGDSDSSGADDEAGMIEAWLAQSDVDVTEGPESTPGDSVGPPAPVPRCAR